MRPFATALFPSDAASTEWLRQMSRAQVQRRIEDTKRRLRGESRDPLDDNLADGRVTRSMSAQSLDIHALAESAAAVRAIQVWAFKEAIEAQRALEEASKNANVDLVRVDKTADVPTW